MTENILGRTEEEIARDQKRARELCERIQGRDWRDLPKGHYAIPVQNFNEYDDEDEWQPATIGYHLFERKVPRVYKNGRRVGGDRFIRGALMAASDVDPNRVRQAVRFERECLPESWGPDREVKSVVDAIMLDLEGDDTYRATFGKLTGKCGCCGKALTDAKSKLIGIGPDCRGYR